MNTTIIPIQLKSTQAKRVQITASQVEELSLAEIPVKDGDSNIRISEVDLEEFVRKNVQLFFPSAKL